MTENFWKDKYPVGIAAEINPDQYPNIQAVLKESCQRFADKPAFTNMGKTLTYGEMYELSGAFAAYLQEHTDLQPGDRILICSDGVSSMIDDSSIHEALRATTAEEAVWELVERANTAGGHDNVTALVVDVK